MEGDEGEALPVSPEVVKRLVDNHREFLRFLARRVGDSATAEDILQEAFARGLDKLGALRDDEEKRAVSAMQWSSGWVWWQWAWAYCRARMAQPFSHAAKRRCWRIWSSRSFRESSSTNGSRGGNSRCTAASASKIRSCVPGAC